MENPSHPTPSSPRRDWAPRATSHGTRVPFETWSKHCEIQLSRAEINLQSSSRVFKGSLLPPKTLSKRKSSTDHGFASEFRSLSISGEPSESILENPFKKHNPQPSLSLSLSCSTSSLGVGADRACEFLGAAPGPVDPPPLGCPELRRAAERWASGEWEDRKRDEEGQVLHRS